MLHVAALMILAVLDGSSTAPANGSAPPKEEQISYDAAYRKAQEEKKPLVVLVGADWCAACKTMKTDTIAPMKSSGQLKEVFSLNWIKMLIQIWLNRSCRETLSAACGFL